MKTVKEWIRNRESEHRVLRCIAITILAILALDVYVLKIFGQDFWNWLYSAHMKPVCIFTCGINTIRNMMITAS